MIDRDADATTNVAQEGERDQAARPLLSWFAGCTTLPDAAITVASAVPGITGSSPVAVSRIGKPVILCNSINLNNR
jgi:hypothetical protein